MEGHVGGAVHVGVTAIEGDPGADLREDPGVGPPVPDVACLRAADIVTGQQPGNAAADLSARTAPGTATRPSRTGAPSVPSASSNPNAVTYQSQT